MKSILLLSVLCLVGCARDGMDGTIVWITGSR